MKNFGKFFLILVWVLLVLGCGYYLLVNNLSTILGAGKPGIMCDWDPSRIRIKTGQWVEVIKFDFPLKISRDHGVFMLKSSQGTITVSTGPKVAIRWHKRSK